MSKELLNRMLLAALTVAVIVHLAVSLSAPASAYDAKVGSDSATVAVAASADGMHVFVCDAKRCYASHDGGKTFGRLNID